MSSKVYFSRTITPQKVVELFRLLEADLPGKVAVTGFDNLFPSSLIDPAITTVHVRRYTMGYSAVEECVRRIQDPEAQPTQTVLDSRLIIRGSSSDLAETAWDLDNW